MFGTLARRSGALVRSAAATRGVSSTRAALGGHHGPIDETKFPGAKDFMGDIHHYDSQEAFKGGEWKAKGIVWFVVVSGCALPIYQLIVNPYVWDFFLFFFFSFLFWGF